MSTSTETRPATHGPCGPTVTLADGTTAGPGTWVAEGSPAGRTGIVVVTATTGRTLDVVFLHRGLRRTGSRSGAPVGEFVAEPETARKLREVERRITAAAHAEDDKALHGAISGQFLACQDHRDTTGAECACQYLCGHAGCAERVPDYEVKDFPVACRAHRP